MYSEELLSCGWRDFETFFGLRSCRGRDLTGSLRKLFAKRWNTLYRRFEKT